MDWKTLVSKVVEFCMSAGIKIVISLVVLIIGFAIIKVLTKTLKKENKFTKMDASLKSFLISFMNIALKVVLLVTVAGYLGFPTASVVTVMGSAAVAVGLSLQGSLSNLAGGIMIVIFKPFKVGDYIDTGSLSGTVTDIGIFYTKLKTPDKKTVILPNGALSNQNLTNYSDTDVRRVDIEVGVDYKSDFEKVKTVLRGIASADERIYKDPEAFVGIKGYGDNSVNFVLRVWCDASEYWNVYFAINDAILKEFAAENIAIPYPQLDVHMK